MNGRRLLRIDALRGLAVFGILLVNVWAFVYPNILRYGVFGDTAGGLDQLTVFAVAAFAEQKFYPIFAFLFGVGFALQTGRRANLERRAAITTRYRRRLAWLLGCGLAHGVLLWYGDILLMYALTAWWIMRFIGLRLSAIVAWLRPLLALNLLIFGALLGVQWFVSDLAPDQINEVVYEVERAHAIYTQGDWWAIAASRVSEFATNVGSGILFFLPRLALLFMLGLFAVRLGYVTRPERHRAFWRRVLVLGLVVGLPLNLWWGLVALRTSIAPFAPAPLAWLATALIDVAGPLLAAAYVAAFMLARASAADWLAPVGRMALTNYLMQSLLLMLLLQGVGIGLGASLGHAALIVLCLPIIALQLLLSRWWLACHARGPMEAIWRRATDPP